MKSVRAGTIVGFLGLWISGVIGMAGAAEPTLPVKPAISDDAQTALQQMAKTLLSKELSFKAQTIRAYQSASG